MNQHRIILAGGSGFLGRALASHFQDAGHEVVILTRSPKPASGSVREIVWDGRSLGDWAKDLEDATAVINLTGKSVNCRYTARNRKEIIDSRVNSTRVIGEAIAKCNEPPRVWLNSSSATIYKHSFDKPMDESCETGATPEAKDAFSIEVIEQWERELAEGQTPRTRKVALRTSMVLGNAKNSVVPVLRRLARFGLGGKMGSGKQMVSWIHEEDFCRAVEWIIAHENLSGHVNMTAPNPLPNREMMHAVRKVCSAPFGLPATEWMLEVGAFFLRTETELIIKSRNAIPRKLIESGFQFQFPVFQNALADLVDQT